ncbi:MAG: 5'-methylthioadenosine/S-adenosylhomocysteine nucleosidase [Oscillospiraceae bacterium]
MRIGLLYAMKGEIESMLTEETPLLQEKAGVAFYRIREDIIACCGGVGKVNAAMATQLFIDLYHPDLMMNVGVAGSFEDLPIGTLVLPDRFMQHDMDTSGIGDPVGLISTVNRMDFPTARQDEARAALDGMDIAYRVGSVATGDWFATECDRARWIADTFHPLLIEMEGCAAAQVCWRNDVEFLALKSVSDCVLAHHDFYFNFPQAMRDLNKTALPLAERLLEG